MDKKTMLKNCAAAMKATDSANDDNTCSAHSTAASMHRIAAEHAKLAGDTDTHAIHADMAGQHDACAGRCKAAADHKVSPPANSEKVLAQNAAGLNACAESVRECPNCHKEVDADKLEGFETGSVICPHCSQKFHPHAEAAPNDKNEGGKPEVKAHQATPNTVICKHCGADIKAEAFERGGKKSGTVNCPSCKKDTDYSIEACDEVDAKAVSDKAGEISAKRMSLKEPLMAAIVNGGLSLNDLNSQVREAIQPLDICKSSSANGPAVICGWVADLVAPANETGEDWTAIVQGDGGKLYAVTFTIGDKKVTISGEPKLVERVTDYDFVGDIETEAKAAAVKDGSLEAAEQKPEVKPTPEPISAKVRAVHDALVAANVNPTLQDVCHAIYNQHKILMTAQEVAANLAMTRKPIMAAAAVADKPNRIQCISGGTNTAVETGNVIMFMPGGINEITPSQNKKAVTVAVNVTAKSAVAIQKQYEALVASGKKPYFSMGEDSHASDIAAFWPSRFFWATRKDVTGKMATGIWCEGEWSDDGKLAVEGKRFRAFSPTFFVDAVRADVDNPSEVICEADAKPNMGALVNDPAFTKNSPLWCRAAGDETMIAREVHDELVASGQKNVTLAGLRSAIFAKHHINLEPAEIARQLMTKK